MYNIVNFLENPNMQVTDQMGRYRVFEHKMDRSVQSGSAQTEFFKSQMNLRRRQLFVELANGGCMIQAGAMQWMLGDVQMESGVRGVGDFVGKMMSAKVTKETIAKPVYTGNGVMMLEPTYNYLLFEDLDAWGGSIVLDDGLFLACDRTMQYKTVARTNASSAILGREGLWNLALIGKGICVLESPVPREELIEFQLQNDQIKIDGNMAIAWSGSLNFTVEKSANGLIDSAIAQEGFVNVYRGTGRVLMAPTIAVKKYQS